MSTKLTGYVWDGCSASGMKLSSVAIMARLADFSSDEGVCWPSIATIARQLGAGESTVRTAIAALEKDGWLTRRARRQGNRNASNVYQLNVKKLQAAAFAHLSDSDASKSDPSNPDASKSDASDSDPSKFDASKSSKTGGFDPSESGGDPSVNSKQDPQVKSKPLCPVSAKPDPAMVLTDNAKLVLSHLCQASGTKHQPGKTSLNGIRARLREGFTPEDLMLVVDYLAEKWGADLDMSDYLRPTTLFRPTNFPGYLKSAKNWHKADRPRRVNGKWENKAQSLTFGPTDTVIPKGFRGSEL